MESSGLSFRVHQYTCAKHTDALPKPRFSFIRTMTVGSGITPDLLTHPLHKRK
ncbi:hypothetical protein CFAEC_00300 [Corynebacterium faecale]|nr:hypothetical protein CFAEC_00300 [Corynebacterium faecale]